MAAITQLGLHGPQMAYGTFTAKTAQASFLQFEMTLYVMQRSTGRFIATQTAAKDLYTTQTAKFTQKVT